MIMSFHFRYLFVSEATVNLGMWVAHTSGIAMSIDFAISAYLSLSNLHLPLNPSMLEADSLGQQRVLAHKLHYLENMSFSLQFNALWFQHTNSKNTPSLENERN